MLGAAVTPEIGAAWSEAVMYLAGILIDREEQLKSAAEKRKGGWRDEREFKLVSKEPVADGIICFSFAAADGYMGGFDYDAGQYMTIRCKDKTPRHYT